MTSVDTQNSEHPDFSDVSVVLPCLNEAAAIGQVIMQFMDNLPGAAVIVFDNGSTDETAKIALAAGAVVLHEPRQGKGNVMRRIFREVDSEIYVLADGDMTYDASAAPMLIAALKLQHLDMVIGARRPTQQSVYRPGHQLGNVVLTRLVSTLFKADLKDMLSGYRVLSRRLVKSFPVDASGFEIETELTVHCLELDAPFIEIETDYAERVEGTSSKLRTWSDGLKILQTVLRLLALERPLVTFGGAGCLAIAVSLWMFFPILFEFQKTGFVTRMPSLIVSTALGLTGLISIFSGMILSGITRTRLDMKRLAYLAVV